VRGHKQWVTAFKEAKTELPFALAMPAAAAPEVSAAILPEMAERRKI
jgi:hypothetical protein